MLSLMTVPGADLLRRPMTEWRNLRALDDAAFGEEHILEFALFHDRAGQKAGVRINRAVRVVEVEWRVRLGQLEVGVIERTDGPDIPPVAVKVKSVHGPGADGVGDHIAAKVVEVGMLGEQIDQHLHLEDIDSHRAEERPFGIVTADHLGLHRGVFWLFREGDNAAFRRALRDRGAQ